MDYDGGPGGIGGGLQILQKQREKKRLQSRKYKATHPLRILLSDAKRRDKRVGVEFDLLESDFDLPLPTHCPILGIPLTYGGGNGTQRQTDSSATIDRIDNRGYVRDAVIIVSWRANRLKSDAWPDELLLLGNFYQRGSRANTVLHFVTSIPEVPAKLY